MKRSRLAHLHPVLQVLALIGLSFSCSMFVGIVSFSLESFIFGAEFGNDVTTLPHRVVKFRSLVNHTGTFLIPSLLFTWYMSSNWKEYLMLQQKNGFKKYVGLLLLPLCLLAVDWLSKLGSYFPMNEWMVEMQETNWAWLNKNLIIENTWDKVILVFSLCILPALGEEFLFRGVFMRMVTNHTNSLHVGVWVSSLIFALLHFQTQHFLSFMLFGGVLGYLLFWTGNIWAGVILHFSNNFLSVLLSSYFGYKETESLTEGYLFGVISLLALIAIYIKFKSKSSWPTFKERYLQDQQYLNNNLDENN